LVHTGQHYDENLSDIFFRVPCLSLRENTERPVTISEGTNLLVGTDPAKIVAAARDVLAGKGKAGRIPPLWDGHAASRIVEVLLRAVPR
jgi:UDP-N-acetylglucosamine 2-epimerase (non-hydrolysing)